MEMATEGQEWPVSAALMSAALSLYNKQGDFVALGLFMYPENSRSVQLLNSQTSQI